MVNIPQQQNNCLALDDKSSTGRDRPWRDLKMANELLSLAYSEIDTKKSERLANCCTCLGFDVDAHGNKRLATANCCRVRLCPLCQWRRSLKCFAQVKRILDFIESKKHFGYILLTLTKSNCVGSELSQNLDLILSAWYKLQKRVEFKNAILGTYRAVEITHNVDNDTFHPHIHALLQVNPSYFKSRDYISQARWSEIWRSCLGVDYNPIVDVRRVKSSDAGVIAEISKYATKHTDYIIPDDWDLTVETVRILDSALHKRRFVSFSGTFLQAHRKLNLDDIDSGDLVRVDDDNQNLIGDVKHRYFYLWYSGYRQYYRGE